AIEDIDVTPEFLAGHAVPIAERFFGGRSDLLEVFGALLVLVAVEQIARAIDLHITPALLPQFPEDRTGHAVQGLLVLGVENIEPRIHVERAVRLVDEPVRVLLADVRNVRVTGAVNTVYPDAALHAGRFDLLEGVFCAAGEFAVPGPPVLRATAVADLIGIIDLDILVAEVGELLFGKHT